MKKVLLLLFIVTTYQVSKAQDYYIYKKNVNKTGKVEEIKALKEEIKVLSDSIKLVSLKKEFTSSDLGFKSLKDTIATKKRNFRGLKKGLNRTLFNDTTRIKTVQLAFGNGDINGQLYSNLINDVFVSRREKYLGEISLGSVMSNTTASDSLEREKASNINNFFNGGGNIFLKYAYLFPAGFSNGYDNFTFLLVPSFRVASNLPKRSQSERLEDWNMELAGEITFSLNGRNNNLGIFFKPKVALAWGSKSFAESILMKSSGQSFTYLQLQAALRVSDSFLINLAFKPLVSRNRRSDYFRETQFSTIGIQALIH